jgi:dihydrofolate reductase
VPVGDLWRRSLDRLRNRIGELASAAETLRVLEEELRSRLAEATARGLDLVRHTGDHVVVVSHRPKPEGWHPEASYHFVDNVTAAVDKAQELAGARTISVNAGDVGSQILAAGLVDEVAMDLVPVAFGSGKRYFGRIDGQLLLEDPHVVIQGDRVLHLLYKVRR